MKEIKGKVKRAVQILWENKYRMTYYMLILCILFGCIHYAESGIWSSANISFNYSEASLGLSPNKTRFNAYEIVSEEVMQRAIEKVGLQGSISASELASHVFITPEGTGHVGGSDDYISTSYNINLNADGLELKNRTTISLLKSICEAYREFFQKNYCDNQDMLKEKLEITTDCEPYLRLNELELRAECIMQYLNARLSENKSYVDTENPDSSTNNFTTLSKQINNIVDYDIPNVKAYVIEGGIANDASLLISILEYKNKIDDIAAQKEMAYYDANKNGISVYEKSMTSVVMIPTTDEMEEYYMSRTKTAMDNMARSADSSLQAATDYQSEIVDTSYVVEKMQTVTDDAGRLKEAQDMINKLESGINEISDQLFILDKAYIRYKSQNYVSFTYNNASFTQRINVKKTGMKAAAVLAFMVGLNSLRKVRKNRKGIKKSEKV